MKLPFYIWAEIIYKAKVMNVILQNPYEESASLYRPGYERGNQQSYSMLDRGNSAGCVTWQLLGNVEHIKATVCKRDNVIIKPCKTDNYEIIEMNDTYE